MTENISEILIPYARSIPVELTAEKLAPNRKHYIFINGVNCNYYVTDTSYDTGEINKIKIITAGKNYVQSTTKINFIGANTRTAKATANVSNGSIIGIDLTDRGSGYKSNVYITISGSGSNANAIPITSFVRGSNIMTDKFGKVVFNMIIPNDDSLKFPVGTLTFIISDHPTDPKLGTSVAVCTFDSMGRKETIEPAQTKTTPKYKPNDIPSNYNKNIPTKPTEETSFKKPGTEIQTTVNDTTVIINPGPLDDNPNTIDTDPDPVDTGGSVPSIDPVTGTIYWSEPKQLGDRPLDINPLFIKSNKLKQGNPATTGDVSGTIDSAGKIKAEGKVTLNGLSDFDGLVPVWDNNKDGAARFSYNIQLPPGTTLTQGQLSQLGIKVTNDKNGKDALKKIVQIKYDAVTNIIRVVFTVKEVQDKLNQLYTVNIRGITTTMVTDTNTDDVAVTYSQQTVDGVPVGKPIVIPSASVPTGATVEERNLSTDPDKTNIITAENQAEIYSSDVQTETKLPISESSGFFSNALSVETEVTQLPTPEVTQNLLSNFTTPQADPPKTTSTQNAVNNSDLSFISAQSINNALDSFASGSMTKKEVNDAVNSALASGGSYMTKKEIQQLKAQINNEIKQAAKDLAAEAKASKNKTK